SMAEDAAADVAVILDLTSSMRIVCNGARLEDEKCGLGKMAAIGISEQESRAALHGFEDRLALAAINGPSSTVWSGDPEALNAALEPLRKNDTFHRVLRGQVAFHSPQMDSLRSQLVASLSNFQPKKGLLP